MFRRLKSIEAWSYAARGVLTTLALLALLPAAVIAALGLAFTLLPAAFLVLPFMMPALRIASGSAHGHPPHIHPGAMLATRHRYATTG